MNYLIEKMQKGGDLLKKYQELKDFYNIAKEAIGKNDTKTLSEIKLDSPYNSNDLTIDYNALQDMRKKLNLPLVEDIKEQTSLTFPHVGQQIRGTINKTIGTHLKNGGNMKYLNRKLQQGGTAPQQGIEQQVMQALQKGMKPEQVLQALVKQGVPQDKATAMIQGIIQQMQEGTQSAKDGAKLEMIGRLQKGKKIVPKVNGKEMPKDASDYVIPTKTEGGTDMNPKTFKKGVSNTATKVKNIPSDDKALIPTKKEKGGYLKRPLTKKEQGGAIPKGEKQKDIAYAKPPKNTFMKGGKSKKCANGCGCKPKLAMHKDGGKLIEVCSCCGAMCN